MANNKSNKKAVVQKKDKVYHNPLETIWGKILIVTMSLLMVASILLSLGYLMYRMSQNV